MTCKKTLLEMYKNKTGKTTYAVRAITGVLPAWQMSKTHEYAFRDGEA